MALEDVIARFCNACNATEKADVTPEAAPALAVTPVTPALYEGDADTITPGGLRWLRLQGCSSAGPEEVQHLLLYLPRDLSARQEALVAYVDTWLKAAEAEPAPHRKENAGRRAANTALREGRLFPKGADNVVMPRPDKTGEKQ